MRYRIYLYSRFTGLPESTVVNLLKWAKQLDGYSISLQGEPPFDWRLAFQILWDLQPKSAQRVNMYSY